MRKHLVYSKRYNTDLTAFGVDKPFALDRGSMVLNQLANNLGYSVGYMEPVAVTRSEMELVHTKEYLDSLKDERTWIDILDLKEEDYNPKAAIRRLPELIDDISVKCGGTALSAKLALDLGLSATLGGGYSHAFPAQGRGFCVLNDIAIAVRLLQKKKLAKRFLVLDLDFHQGDGTALIFRNDSSVFTLSVHSQEGWPEEKQESCLDIAIKEDESHLYLEKTAEGIEKMMKCFSPDIVLYIAGSDPYEKDMLPGTRFIKLTLADMKQRDQFVVDYFADRQIPLTMLFAGGFGPEVWRVHYYAVLRLLERSGVLPALVKD